MSTTSSCTPSRAEYSCSTPVIFTSVGAYPGIDDSSTRRSALPSVCPYPRSNGSITTLAWNGDMLCTSIMRGFNRTLLCMRYLGKLLMDTAASGSRRRRRTCLALLRVELHDQALVDVLPELRAVGRALERTRHLLRVHLDPRREADLLRELQRVLDAQLRL